MLGPDIVVLLIFAVPSITSVTTNIDYAILTWEPPEFHENIMVNIQGYNITYTYVGPCTGEISQSQELSLMDGEARSVEIGGLLPYSDYTVTLETIYPSDVVSTSTLITTLATGKSLHI